MRPRLNYANVVSTLALCFAVGTGGAFAATQIDGKNIKKNSITGSKIKKTTITHREINEKKLKAVPRAISADSLAGQSPAAFLPAGGTAANSNQLGGIGPSGFVQGGGSLTAGRTDGQAANPGNVVRTFQTAVGDFRLTCDAASADARYFNTGAGEAEVYRTYGDDPASSFNAVAQNGDAGFAATAGTGPQYVEIRVGKGTSMVALRVGERRNGNTCIWNWELVQSG